MSLLAQFVHPGAHPHPHDSDWFAVIADSPWVLFAIVAVAVLMSGYLGRAIARRD